jgi:hypothetical protein
MVTEPMSTKDPDLQPEQGDRIVAGDDLSIGDIVWFDTAQQPGLIIIRKVLPGSVPDLPSALYRVEPGDAPNTLVFTPVEPRM